MNINNIFSTRGVRKSLSVSSTIGILVLFLALPISAPAQGGGVLSGVGPDFLTSGLFGGGLTFIDGDAYIQVQLQPDIPLGKVGIGLDLVLLYNPFADDPDARFLAEDGESWGSPSTWLRLIRYFRYGQPYDPFYFRFGELDYLTIGHGSIMSGYSNYDRRGLRFNLRKSNNRYGIETMINDLGSPSIFGGRLFWRPMLRPENNNFLTRFELGATYLTDINPNLHEEGEEPLTALGVDAGFPIFERSTFRLDLYNDFTVLNTLSDAPEGVPEEPLETESIETESTENKPTRRLESAPIGENESVAPTEFTWGNAVGIGFAFTQAVFKLEYRILGEGYTPSLFDYTYESAKSLTPEPDVPEFLGLETDTESRRGFYSQLIWRPMPQIHFFGTFEDYSNSEPKLYIGIAESGLVPRLSLRGYYTKRDVGEGDETGFFGDLFDLDEKSGLSLEVRYVIFPPIETIILREYRFRRVETAEGTFEFEPIHKTSFMIGISKIF